MVFGPTPPNSGQNQGGLNTKKKKMLKRTATFFFFTLKISKEKLFRGCIIMMNVILFLIFFAGIFFCGSRTLFVCWRKKLVFFREPIPCGSHIRFILV